MTELHMYLKATSKKFSALQHRYKKTKCFTEWWIDLTSNSTRNCKPIQQLSHAQRRKASIIWFACFLAPILINGGYDGVVVGDTRGTGSGDEAE